MREGPDDGRDRSRGETTPATARQRSCGTWPTMILTATVRALASGSLVALGLCVAGACGARSEFYAAPRPDASASSGSCASAFATPGALPDEALVRCGITNHLGDCWVQTGCASCACSLYVKRHSNCDATGACGPPIDGTGCAVEAYYSADPWRCRGDSTAVAACMLRRLLAEGYCTH